MENIAKWHLNKVMTRGNKLQLASTKRLRLIYQSIELIYRFTDAMQVRLSLPDQSGKFQLKKCTVHLGLHTSTTWGMGSISGWGTTRSCKPWGQEGKKSSDDQVKKTWWWLSWACIMTYLVRSIMKTFLRWGKGQINLFKICV